MFVLGMLPQRGPMRTQPKVALVHPQTRNPSTLCDPSKSQDGDNTQKNSQAEPNAILKQLLRLEDEDECVDGRPNKSPECGNRREKNSGKALQKGASVGEEPTSLVRPRQCEDGNNRSREKEEAER